MIDWKDTVMSDEQIRLVNPNECVCGITDARDMCKAQAEITGKIMLEQGRREVVEWIHEPCSHKNESYFAHDCPKCCRAQKKI